MSFSCYWVLLKLYEFKVLANCAGMVESSGLWEWLPETFRSTKGREEGLAWLLGCLEVLVTKPLDLECEAARSLCRDEWRGSEDGSWSCLQS